MASTPPPKPGVLWVSSGITQPRKLTPAKFTSWYEDTHIHEVLATGGVPSSTRYEALPPHRALTPTMAAAWLTVYEMPDVEFRHAAAFKGLDGQKTPKGNLLQEIFENAIYKTRFCAMVSVDEADGVKEGPAKFVVSETVEVPSGSQEEEKVKAWYQDVRVPAVRKVNGWVRSRRFKIVDSTVLDEFRRRDGIGNGDKIAYLTLHEFDGDEFPFDSISSIEGLEEVNDPELGYFRRKRIYGEFERLPNGK